MGKIPLYVGFKRSARALRKAKCSNWKDVYWYLHGLHVQWYLAHKKTPPRGTLQQAYAQGPMVVLGGGGGALSYGRGTLLHVTMLGSILSTNASLNLFGDTPPCRMT